MPCLAFLIFLTVRPFSGPRGLLLVRVIVEPRGLVDEHRRRELDALVRRVERARQPRLERPEVHAVLGALDLRDGQALDRKSVV